MRQRRNKVLWLIFLCSIIFFGAMDQNAIAFGLFGKDKPPPKAIVVFVDMSGSTNKARRTVYRNAFDKIYKSLKGGDRIVVGTITSRSYIDFKAAVDAEIPEESIWVNRLRYEQQLAKTKNDVKKAVKRLLARKRGTPWTEILNSLNIADTLFHNEKKRQKILVILSDMIQDSQQFRFEKSKINNKYISDLIRMRKKQNLIPNLSGVKIYVAGASAKSTRKYRSIEKFWTRYFDVSRADFSSHRYGHSLIEFEKGS